MHVTTLSTGMWTLNRLESRLLMLAKIVKLTLLTAATRRHCDSARFEKNNNNAALPLNFVKGKGFHQLLAYIEPEYIVPGSKMVTSTLEPNHNKIKEEEETHSREFGCAPARCS